MYKVYIIYSKIIDKYYVGYTNEIDRRIKEHNRVKGKFTDRGIPWEIVYTEIFDDKNDAIKREAEIKAKKSRIYIESLISISR